MTKADKFRQLTRADGARLSIEQENAIDLLLQGKSDRETAEAVGVSRQTVTEWRNKNSLFAAELNRRRQEIWSNQEERLRRLVGQAVNVLEEDLSSKANPKLRQAAAVHILRAVGLYGTEIKPKGATTPEDVEGAWKSAEMWADLAKM